MANAKISALTALAGADVETSADVIPIVDTSVTTTKKILVDELAVAMRATQAEVDAATSANTLLSPSLNRISLATEQATTSGTEIDFVAIPAATRRITINFFGVSTNGTSIVMVQLGDAGGFETTGYISSAGMITSSGVTGSTGSTAGFLTGTTSSATASRSGSMVLSLENAATFAWTCTSNIAGFDGDGVGLGAGRKALSAALTQVRITTVNGTDAFDAGAINISFER